VMEAFEGYWRKTPSVKRLVFRSMPDETTRAAALKAGDVDIVYLLSGPTAADVKRTPGLRLVASKPPGVPYLDMPEQWDPKSPWHDRRVRLAASHAIDREGLNQAETLGLSRPTGALIPRVLDFAKVYEPPPYDPARAKQLLAEAGFPNGFDAGDLTPFPPFFSMGEGLVNYLQAVGIRTRMRTMERAAFLGAWRDKKIRGVIMGLGAPAGNAATRIEVYVTKNGIYSSAWCRRSRTCTPARRASWIARSARRCCTRSSRSCTIASCTCPSTSWPSCGVSVPAWRTRRSTPSRASRTPRPTRT